MGFGSRRVMGLGLPLLSILTVSQFRAVLAHEFAHYYGGDTSLGPWVYKTQNAMVRIFQNIGSVGKVARVAVLSIMCMVVGTLMKWYFKLFLRAINLASRQREYRADELACFIAGRQALIDGLRRSATACAIPRGCFLVLSSAYNEPLTSSALGSPSRFLIMDGHCSTHPECFTSVGGRPR